MNTRPLSMFVSSTAADLHPFREVARRVIAQQHWQPKLLLEDRLVPGGLILPSCRAVVQSCDLFLLIAGYRYGWVPAKERGGDGRRSITGWELHYWHEKSLTQRVWAPVIMMAQNKALDANTLLLDADARAQRWFREQVRERFIVHWFDYDPCNPDDPARLTAFESLLRNQLATLRTQMVRVQEQQLAAQQKQNDLGKYILGGLVGAAGLALLSDIETSEDDEGGDEYED